MTDLRVAVRQLSKSPGFTLVAVLTLALGIGLNTAMFSFLNGLLLRPLPFPDAASLVRLHRETPHGSSDEFSLADYRELRRNAAAFGRFAAFRRTAFVFRDSDRSLDWVQASSDVFEVLGVQPVLGRSFRPEDETPGNDRIALLSDSVWRSQFGGAPDVVGRTIRGNGETLEIVGVLPPAVTDHRLFGRVGLFSPLALSGAADEFDHVAILGRRRPDLPAARGDAFVETFGARRAAERPLSEAGHWLDEPLRSSSVGATGQILLAMLLGLSTFVLLIACSNLASVLLAKVIAGAHDFGVRTALGATKWRSLQPLVLESAILVLAGGAGALLVAQATIRWLQSVLVGGGMPGFDFPMDWRVLGFALGAALLTLAFFGLGPALFATRLDAIQTMRTGTRLGTPSRGHQRLRHLLIAGQFALALVLMAGAGFFVRGTLNLMEQRYGWSSDDVLQAEVVVPPGRYESRAEIGALYRRLEERLQALAGVRYATVSYGLPYLGLRGRNDYIVEGRSDADARTGLHAWINAASPSYFDVTGTPLLSGRTFDAGDTAVSRKVAIIGESMARALFGDLDPLGRRLAATDSETPDWLEIVGVVADVRSIDVAQRPSPYQLYQPIAQDPHPGCVLAVRTLPRRAPGAVLASMRAAVAEVDPNLAVRDLETVNVAMSSITSQMYMCRQLLLSFALLGLFLAALGIYGAIARMVSQRAGEFGVRMALGARASDLVRLVLGSGLRLVVAGAAIGAFGAFGLSRALSAALPAMVTDGTGVGAAATAVLIVVALLACWMPARRAAEADPMTALRSE